MTITVKDMDQVEAWTGAVLPPGPHYVRIDSIDDTGQSQGGDPQLEMEFVSEAGLGSIRDWLTVKPETYGKVRQLLDAAGIVAQGGEWGLPTDQLKGKKLYIIVAEVEKWDDPTKKVKRVVEYKHFDASDLPVDTGNGVGAPLNNDDDLPF